MLVNNDSNLKLLKMKEKLLESSSVNREKNLDDYSELASKIDSFSYNNLIEKIHLATDNNYTLLEEIKFLEDVEHEYMQLDELQHRLRKVFSKYSSKELELSDLSKIRIEEIRNRKSVISGYLINIENIEKDKKKLEELQEKLIDESKKRDVTINRLHMMDKELTSSFMNAEGRLRDDTGLKSTSINTEYMQNGFNLNRLFNDKEYLDQVYTDVINNYNDKNGLFVAAVRLPVAEDEYKDVFRATKMDAIKAKYQRSLIEMVRKLKKEDNSVSQARDKRKDLQSLIKYRKDYLDNFKIIYEIDPFSRINLSNQLEFINSIQDNDKKIKDIRKQITDINTKLENMISSNKELKMSINDRHEYLVPEEKKEIVDYTSLGDYIDFGDTDSRPDNMVVSIKDINDKFNMKKATEIVNNVINRVYKMLTTVSLPYDKVDTQDDALYPELLIESKVVDNKLADEPILKKVEEPEKVKASVLDSDIFHDETPFESVPLFTDKVIDSSNIFNETKKPVENISNNNEILNDEFVNFSLPSSNEEESLMPDIGAYWTGTPVTNDNNTDLKNDNVISFDEEVNRLINGDTKTMKRAI